MINAAEAIAKAFHEAYERLAPDYGFETPRGPTDWEEVPEEDRSYMVAIISELLDSGVIAAGESILV